MEIVKINISDFSSCIGYCEFIIVNKYHLKLKPELTHYIKRGSMIHKILEIEDKLIPREEATKEQLMDPFVDLDFTREGIYVCIERVNMNKFRYIGKVDKVIRQNGNIYIIDDRVVSQNKNITLYLDKFLQTACYCEGFLRNYSHFLRFNKIFINIIFRDNEGRILEEFKKEYNSNIKNYLNEKFMLFEEIYNRVRKPKHHNNPKKCNACKFRKNCNFKVDLFDH